MSQKPEQQAKTRGVQHHCESIRISLVVPEEEFSPEVFGKEFLGFDGLERDQLRLSGPLRVGGRATPDLALTGRAEFHQHDEESHFYFVVAGLRPSTRVSKETPTLRTFLNAIKKASGDRDVDMWVYGRHSFPKSEWRGILDLPVPLPFGSKEQQNAAQMVGVEVGYEGALGPETVLLSSADSEYVASTRFRQLTQISATLLTDAIAASEGIATRLLNQVARQKQENPDE